MNKQTPAEKEYWRRLCLCEKKIFKAAKAVGLSNEEVMEDFSGCGISVDTEVPAGGKVIVIMMTGHPPRLSKYMTLSVHGVVWLEINQRVKISGGGLGESEQKFLPDNISLVWLKKAITKASDVVRNICTVQNMERLRKEALTKRRREIKEDKIIPSGQNTYLDLNEKK